MPDRVLAEAGPDAARAARFRELARDVVERGRAEGDAWAPVQGLALLRMADRFAERQKLPPDLGRLRPLSRRRRRAFPPGELRRALGLPPTNNEE